MARNLGIGPHGPNGPNVPGPMTTNVGLIFRDSRFPNLIQCADKVKKDLLIFGNFSMVYDFFTPEYEYSYSKINFASTSNSGTPFSDPQRQVLIFIFSKVRPEFRTFGRNLERSAGISRLRPESRTFCGFKFTFLVMMRPTFVVILDQPSKLY